MNTFFECKVKYETIDEQTGKEKRVNLPYLVDAVSYSEAEARIHEMMEQYVSGEFSISSIKKTNYTEIFFFETGDKWYKCKVKFVSVDEGSGREKKTTSQMLVIASYLKEAYDRLYESLGVTTVSYDNVAIIESNIVEVFPYLSND